MKRFVFELEKVLDLRKYKERETEIALGRAISVLNEIEDSIASVDEERKRLSRQIPKSAIDIIAFDRYAQKLDATKERLLKEAEEAQRKVDEAREIYLAASRDRKAIDNLKERRAQEYRKFVLTEETKTLDDISSGVKARQLTIG